MTQKGWHAVKRNNQTAKKFISLGNVRNCEEKERVKDGWVCIRTGVRLQFFLWNCFYFVQLSRDWYRANSKRLIISSSLCFSISFFWVSESASSRFSTFMSLFLHIYLLRAPSISRYIIILVSLVLLRPFSTSQPRVVWHKTSTKSGLTSSDYFADSFVFHGRKSSVVINFPDAYAVLVVILPPGMLLTQFTWHFRSVFFSLGDRWTSCFATYITYSACKRNLPIAIQQASKRVWTPVTLLCSLSYEPPYSSSYELDVILQGWI